MDIDSTVAPNELAISLANKCRKWTYESYSGEYEVNEVPRNPNVDRQYETRLDRAISDIQTKVYAQKRALEEVHATYIVFWLMAVTEKSARGRAKTVIIHSGFKS